MNKTIEKIIKERQTTKEYSDKKIDKKDWKQILEMIYWSPSSHGFEPYRVLIINKENPLRKELKPMMWGQGVIENSDKLIFFITLNHEVYTNDEWIRERIERRVLNVAGLSGDKATAAIDKSLQFTKDAIISIDKGNGNHWSMKQAYIALGNSLTAATMLDIGSTALEGLVFEDVEELFRSNNLINDNESLAVGAAFGYPSSETAYAHRGTGKRVRDDWDTKFKEI